MSINRQRQQFSSDGFPWQIEHQDHRIRSAASQVAVRNHVTPDAIADLLPKASAVIGTLASPETVKRVAARNADAIWSFARRGTDKPEGFQSVLLLNADGLEALLSRNLNLLDPPNEVLVGQAERPAAIYVWATYTPGRLAAAIPLVFEHFSAPRYALCDIYSMANTLQGARSMERLGFERGVVHKGITLPDLYVCRRNPMSIQAARPRYDSYVAATGTGIHVAHGIDDFFRIAAIRSAVYLGEQACPFAEEFDGNDHAATHLIGWRDHEPAACLRLRFFARFAKLERLAVRREFRRSQLAFEMVRAAVDLCRAKGFERLYGHARQDLLPFWQRFGFKLKENGAPFSFSGHVFVEMLDDRPLDKDPIDVASDPYVTIRPEGRWHRPGVLETSAASINKDR